MENHKEKKVNIQYAKTEFLKFCRYQKNLSVNTIKAYSIDLLQFQNYCETKNNIEIVYCSDRHVLKEYIAVLSTNKPKTIKRKIACLKTFFEFIRDEKYIEINPFSTMKFKIREDKTLPRIIPLKEITKLLKHLHSEKNKEINEYLAFRDLIIVELLFLTGCRVSEIANLKNVDINVDERTILVNGKGKKERVIHISNNQTRELLKDYLLLFKERIKLCNGRIFINRLGAPISTNSIRDIIRRVCLTGKINRKITPHMFRHSLATLLLQNDVDIKHIQSILGHSSISTTLIYTHINIKSQNRLFELKHPRSKVLF